MGEKKYKADAQMTTTEVCDKNKCYLESSEESQPDHFPSREVLERKGDLNFRISKTKWAKLLIVEI